MYWGKDYGDNLQSGAATEFWVGWGNKDFLAPQPNLAIRWGDRGSGGVLTFHCYFLINKDNYA